MSDENTIQTVVLCSQEVVERDGVVTVISTSFVPDDAKAMIAIQVFNGPGGYANSLLLHPKTCRALAKIDEGVACVRNSRGVYGYLVGHLLLDGWRVPCRWIEYERGVLGCTIRRC